MPKQNQKSLIECLSKMKISNKQLQFPIRSCQRRIKTLSFIPEEPNQNRSQNDAVTLSDIDKFLLENFGSLYRKETADGGGDGEDEEDESLRRDEIKTAAFLVESPGLLANPPPENLCSSARFFVASGSSSSLLTASENSSEAEAKESPAPDDFIALLTYSPSPYEEFRRSMQEMVDARVEHNGKVDWEFLEELLFCYLDLNNKKSYRYILRAFVDLIVVLRENSVRVPARRPALGGEGWRKQSN
ncbi:hypothetical protein CASFOL_025976 [Castilleja foliolosa]|uniref:Transcription repressor n=1 Tax=Castilleja foliolosa TaxID=1961234 RepID=A0ABD3CU27_9LAMI